jgi:hypothetical protein
MTNDEDLKRRIVYAIISAILTFAAARLAIYITNKILGEQPQA